MPSAAAGESPASGGTDDGRLEAIEQRLNQTLRALDELRTTLYRFALTLGMATALVLGAIRRKRGREPSRKAEANRLELGYVGVLTGVFIFLAVTGLMANAKDYGDAKPAVTVRVTGSMSRT